MLNMDEGWPHHSYVFHCHCIYTGPVNNVTNFVYLFFFNIINLLFYSEYIFWWGFGSSILPIIRQSSFRYIISFGKNFVCNMTRNTFWYDSIRHHIQWHSSSSSSYCVCVVVHGWSKITWRHNIHFPFRIFDDIVPVITSTTAKTKKPHTGTRERGTHTTITHCNQYTRSTQQSIHLQSIIRCSKDDDTE